MIYTPSPGTVIERAIDEALRLARTAPVILNFNDVCIGVSADSTRESVFANWDRRLLLRLKGPGPVVRVIGHTKFLGVPDELLPKGGYAAVQEKHQDAGTECARLIECAGRTCYDSYGAGRQSAEYHEHIKHVGHGSVAEHSSINFFISNVSRGLTHELVRHRSGTVVSQRSTRYVDESGSSWVLHPLLTKMLDADTTDYPEVSAVISPHSLKEHIGNLQRAAQATYDAIVTVLQGELIKAGVDKFTARKQARGAARGLLGNALMTELVWTANIRALRNVIEQRASPAADAEIRVLANRLFEEAIQVCPEYFDDYVLVECPDGIGYALETKFRKI